MAIDKKPLLKSPYFTNANINTYITVKMMVAHHEHVIETKSERGGARACANQKSQSAGHDDYPPAKLYTGSPDVWVNGMPIARRWDVLKEHSNAFSGHEGMLYYGSDTVFANELPVCRVGDRFDMVGGLIDVGATDNLYIPIPVVCEPLVGVGGTDNYPSLHIHKEKEEGDDFTWLAHKSVRLCWSLYYNEFRMPFVATAGGGGGCPSVLMTGSDDVNVGHYVNQVFGR